jgi:small subunit ribosomal protein S2
MEDATIAGEQPLLIAEDLYLTSGVHIGTQQKSADMRRFIFKVRNDGLYVLDIKSTDDRIRTGANFLSKFEPKRTLVVCQRQYGQKPARTFAKNVGAKSMVGRFVPGTLTNPRLPTYFEPDIIVVTDPSADQQALREAVNIGIPVIALCDANNDLKYVDLAIPANNKGRRSLALVYWLLTRETLKAKKVITRDDEFLLELEEFEATL